MVDGGEWKLSGREEGEKELCIQLNSLRTHSTVHQPLFYLTVSLE
jgi:hypothetical protein